MASFLFCILTFGKVVEGREGNVFLRCGEGAGMLWRCRLFFVLLHCEPFLRNAADGFAVYVQGTSGLQSENNGTII